MSSTESPTEMHPQYIAKKTRSASESAYSPVLVTLLQCRAVLVILLGVL